MWGLLPEQERHYVVTGVLTAVVTVVAAALLWSSPLSPVSLDRTAARAASGDANTAVVEYLELANGWGPSDRKGEALWRAALLTDVALENVERSATMLEQLVIRFPSHRRVPDAHARMAMIHREHHGDLVRAGMRWVAGASVDPSHPDAGRWMLNAGIAFADAGDLDSAHAALSAAAARPDQAVAARLAEGRLHLITDPAQAYADYDAAFRAGATGDARRLARLGMATALEHLDRREQALAELDDAVEGTDRGPALRRRRDRLAARRAQ